MSQSQSESQGGRDTKRQRTKRNDREFASKFDAFEEQVRGSAPDVVKTDETGRQTFLELAGQLEAIQEDQLRFAQIGLKRSKQIAQGGNSFSVKDFIKNLQNKYPAQAQDEAGEGSGIDWKKNSQEAAEYFAATPAALFLANPLGKSFEPKPRKEIVRSKRRENVEEERPVVEAEGDSTDNKSSEKRKQQLLKAIQKLKRGERISFAEIITDPHSFGETCENMFACSFLVERNDLAIDLNDEGQYMAELVEHGQEGAPKHEAENLRRDICKMDQALYEKLVQRCYPQGTANAKPFFKFDPLLPEDKTLNQNAALDLEKD